MSYYDYISQQTILFTCLYFWHANGATFDFFHNIRPEFHNNPRRIFGGSMASLSDFPHCCLLANDRQHPRCTGSIITPRFVITAAHCVKPNLHYIFYNSRVPIEGDYALVYRIYRHPHFSYMILTTDYGPDVMSLYHDIGLVESNKDMIIPYDVPYKSYLEKFDIDDILWTDVDILGFGNRGPSRSGPELLSVKLQVLPCYRDTWQYCACALAADGGARGVCTGDSGGPVVRNGKLVGVTSLGPPGCTSNDDPSIIYIDVFTVVANYVDIINDTINHKPNAMMELTILKPLSLQSSSSSLHSYYLCNNIFILISIFNFIFCLP